MTTAYIADTSLIPNLIFTIREGEWKVRLNGEVLPTVWNSKGAAKAGLKTEICRRNREAKQEQANE